MVARDKLRKTLDDHTNTITPLMESVYKELSKLESLGSAHSSTPSTKKPKLKLACPTIYHILDHLVDRLTAAQQQLSRSGNWNNAAELLDLLEADIKGSKENVEEVRFSICLASFGKGLILLDDSMRTDVEDVSQNDWESGDCFNQGPEKHTFT